MCVSITTKVGDLIHEDMKFTFCRGRPYRNMPCHPCRHQNHFRHPACFGFLVFPRQKLETRLHFNVVLFIWFDLRLLCSSQVWHDLRWPFFFGQVVLRLSFFFVPKFWGYLKESRVTTAEPAGGSVGYQMDWRNGPIYYHGHATGFTT